MFVLYFILFALSFFIAGIVSRRDIKIAYYRAVMSDLTEIGSALQADTGAPLSSDELMKQYATSDIRIANLKYFFRKYNSPLYDYADAIVAAADQYQFDYRLLPAIAMQESTLCKFIYEGSHNCWGWGIYGSKVTRFDSYNEAIATISHGIKRDYIDKGLTTPEEIMQKYTPPSDGSWARGVNNSLKIID